MAKVFKFALGEVTERHFNVFCVVEQYKYNEQELFGIDPNLILAKGLCKYQGGKITFQFTGFVVMDNTLIVSFPKGYNLPMEEESMMEHLRALSGTLLRYQQEGNLSIDESDYFLFGSDYGDSFGIGPALWLMNDYMKFGLLRRELRVKQVGYGANIDWARTVRTIDPYIISNRPVYLDQVVRKTNKDHDNQLVLLHQYAIQECFRLYGWVLGRGHLGLDFPIKSTSFEINFIDQVLKQELLSTNVDREIKVIQMVRHFLLGTGKENEVNTLNALATFYFHTIWERICGFLFDNEYLLLKNYVPKPVWHWKYKMKQKQMKQIPDILYRYKGELYVLDAKYYDTTYGLPGWTDLVKQFFYAYSLSNSNKSYKNVLVFPSCKEKILEYCGYVDFKDREDLGIVEAIGLNTFFAMKNYAYYSSDDLREQLKNLLLDESKKEANMYSFSINL